LKTLPKIRQKSSQNSIKKKSSGKTGLWNSSLMQITLLFGVPAAWLIYHHCLGTTKAGKSRGQIFIQTILKKRNVDHLLSSKTNQ
jgi:hypothetical protein